MIDSELLKPRNTVAECYQKVLNDLNDAESLITSSNLNYASKNAAIENEKYGLPALYAVFQKPFTKIQLNSTKTRRTYPR